MRARLGVVRRLVLRLRAVIRRRRRPDLVPRLCKAQHLVGQERLRGLLRCGEVQWLAGDDQRPHFPRRVALFGPRSLVSVLAVRVAGRYCKAEKTGNKGRLARRHGTGVAARCRLCGLWGGRVEGGVGRCGAG